MVPICRHPCDPMSQYIIDIQYSPRGNYPHISIPELAGGKVAMLCHVHVHWFTFRNHAVSNGLFSSVFHVRGDFWLGKCQRTENPALFWSAGHNLAMMVGWFLSFLRVISFFSNPVLSQPNGLGLLGRLQWLNSIFRVYNEFTSSTPPTSFTLINRHNALSTFQESLTERNIFLGTVRFGRGPNPWVRATFWWINPWLVAGFCIIHPVGLSPSN